MEPSTNMELSTFAKLIELLLLAVVAIVGCLWQYGVIIKNQDFENGGGKYVIALIIGILGSIGILVRAFMSSFDERINIDGAELIGEAIAQIIFLVIVLVFFSIKLYFSPLLTTFIVLSAIYNLFEYGEFHIWNFAEKYLSLFMLLLPDYARSIYVMIVLILTPLSAIFDTLGPDFLEDLKDRIFG